MSWLTSLGIKAFLDWALGKILALINSLRVDKENHDAQVDQAAQDMAKAKELKPEATAQEVDEAINDALKHL